MVAYLFTILFFLIPLVFTKNTSEIFEFNKIIILYSFTVLISTSWIIKSIVNRSIVFKKTILDYPLVLFVVIQGISTFFSIDPHTSIFGYYSRFNGGLLSVICYALLYWAFVSNVNKKQTKYIIYSAIFSVFISSILAILEHYNFFATCALMGFGFTTSCWVQDVVNRVFSTFGQPNWLAAAIVALLPISNQLSRTKFQIIKTSWFLISVLFFITLLFTKSKSGLLAFGVESIIFLGIIFWKSKLKFWKEFLTLNLSFIILFFVFSPFTLDRSPSIVSDAPALETGGTNSGQIRKSVWKGAVNIWKNHPLLGTGPETFAYSFQMYKPIEHNLTSEWDFIYNKAHNEYLNYLATTGTLGLISYLALIFTSIALITNYFKKHSGIKKGLKIAILSGYVGILITNFFGFSVVFTSLMFFLFPAIAVAYSTQDVKRKRNEKPSLFQWFTFLAVLLTACYLLHTTFNYWLADVAYNKGKNDNLTGDFENAEIHLTKAIKLNPKEPLILSELAISLSATDIKESVNLAQKAHQMLPINLNIIKNYYAILASAEKQMPGSTLEAISVMEQTIEIFPNNPKINYQLGALYINTSNTEKGIEYIQKSIELKGNYKQARYALGVIYKDLKMYELAKEEFEYILLKIDPNDKLAKKHLEEISSF